MAYATPDDLVARFGEAEMARLSTPEGEALSGVRTPTLAAALATASDIIDSFLRRRYAVPLAAPVPPAVARVCLLLARYDLAHGRGHEPSDQIRRAHEQELKWLGMIADGDATLDGAVAAAPVGGDAPVALATDRERVFSDDSLRGW